MEFADVLKAVEQCAEHGEWRKTHAKAFLAHAFVMLDEANKNTWQVGYFDDATSTMSTFVTDGKKIDVIPDQEVLKAEQQILPLNADEVKLPVAEALTLAQKAKMQHYPQEMPAKTFFIIQNIAAHGQVFNVTYFTVSFKTINIKLSTTDGKVVHHSMQALAAFG